MGQLRREPHESATAAARRRCLRAVESGPSARGLHRARIRWARPRSKGPLDTARGHTGCAAGRWTPEGHQPRVPAASTSSGCARGHHFAHLDAFRDPMHLRAGILCKRGGAVRPRCTRCLQVAARPRNERARGQRAGPAVHAAHQRIPHVLATGEPAPGLGAMRAGNRGRMRVSGPPCLHGCPRPARARRRPGSQMECLARQRRDRSTRTVG